MPTPTKKRSFSLPHSGKRVWKPTGAQVAALAALKSQRKPVHFTTVCEAWNVVGGLAQHGYVDLTEGIEGSMVRITESGRALVEAVRRDLSLLRTAAKKRD